MRLKIFFQIQKIFYIYLCYDILKNYMTLILNKNFIATYLKKLLIKYFIFSTLNKLILNTSNLNYLNC